MLASINPLGERARGTRFMRTFAWYLVGSVIGALVVAAGLGAVGEALHDAIEPSPGALAIVVAVLTLLALGAELRLGPLRIPTVRRQVNEDWLGVYRGWIYGFGFGAELGMGMVTVVTTTSVYLMLVLELLVGSLPAALAIGAIFGVGRALPLLAVSTADEPSELRRMLRWVHDLARPVDRLARTSVAVLAAVAVGFAIGGVA